jgi:hypothetical protein
MARTRSRHDVAKGHELSALVLPGFQKSSERRKFQHKGHTDSQVDALIIQIGPIKQGHSSTSWNLLPPNTLLKEILTIHTEKGLAPAPRFSKGEILEMERPHIV